MRVIDAPQRSIGWYEARLGVPTASHAADVIGRTRAGKPLAARATYAHRLIAERLAGPQPQVTTAAMQRGIDQEPDVIELYASRTGLPVEPVGFVLHDSGRFGASPDGLVADGLVEIKTTAPHLFVDLMLSGPDAPLRKHAAQMTCQCVVTGRPWCDLALWCEPLGNLWVGRWEPSAEELDAMELAMLDFADELDTMEERVVELLAETAMSSLDVMPGAAE